MRSGPLDSTAKRRLLNSRSGGVNLRNKTMKEISNRTEVVLRVIGKVTEVSETGKSFKIQQVSINDLPQHYRDRLGQMHLCRQREDTTEYKFENKP